MIAWALVIFFFSSFPIQYKDFSVICDPSAPVILKREITVGSKYSKVALSLLLFCEGIHLTLMERHC